MGFFSLGSCSTAADSFKVQCAIILLGVGAVLLEKCDVIVVTILPFSGKETKRMALPDPSSFVFTTLQESLRIQKDSILGIIV